MDVIKVSVSLPFKECSAVYKMKLFIVPQIGSAALHFRISNSNETGVFF